MPWVAPQLILGGRASFAYVDDVGIAITNVKTWTDADVERYLREMTTLAGRVTAKATILRFFGDVFGAHHRRLIVDWLKKEGLSEEGRACVLTDSAMLRGAMTAYAWLTRSESAAYAPSDLRAACQWATRGLRARPEAVEKACLECHHLLGQAVDASHAHR